MTRPLVRSLILSCAITLLAASADAQLPGASSGGATSAGSASKPIASGDRTFIKNAGEQIVTVSKLAEMTRAATGPGSESVKKMNVKLKDDFDKVWGEIGTVAAARKVELPKTDLSPSDKAAMDKLRKTEADKFDKAFLKALNKEIKKAAQIFEAGEKSVQDPELKTVATTWSPKIKAYADEVAKAEDEASKKK